MSTTCPGRRFCHERPIHIPQKGHTAGAGSPDGFIGVFPKWLQERDSYAGRDDSHGAPITLGISSIDIINEYTAPGGQTLY